MTRVALLRLLRLAARPAPVGAPALLDRARAERVAAPLSLETALLAQLGDPHACRVLVEAHHRAVVSLIARLCAGRRGAVDDLAQETFLRVFRALAGFAWDGTATLSTWILTVATRTALDELKRPWARRWAPLSSDDDATFASPDLSPEERAQLGQTRRWAEDALAQLPTDQRAALVLRVFHDLSYAEIARVVGADEVTVKTRIHRARASLRMRMGGVDA